MGQKTKKIKNTARTKHSRKSKPPTKYGGQTQRGEKRLCDRAPKDRKTRDVENGVRREKNTRGQREGVKGYSLGGGGKTER